MQIQVRQRLELLDETNTIEHDGAPVILPVREAEAAMGETVQAFLARVKWHFDLPTICVINGECYSRAEWATRALSLNDNVEFRSRPMGSGSGGSTAKSIAAVVALVALTAVAGPAGGAVAGALGFTGAALTAATAISSAIIVGVGSLAISYFLRPKSGGKDKSSDPLQSFGLGGNQAKAMQPIPVLNGRLKFSPEYAAPTYSEYFGDGMIDYALFALTCGRMDIEKVFIGDSEIWDKNTGPNPSYPGITLEFIDPGNQVTLYPVNVVSASELQGVELTTDWSQPFIPAPSGTSTIEVLIDLIWPGGSYHTGSKGQTIPANTGVELQTRAIDDAGAPVGDWLSPYSKVFTFAKQSQIRLTERLSWPGGRWEYRMRRTNPPTQEGNGTDSVTWTALRAKIDGPQSFPRVMTMAVKGVASKQLSGVNGGQLKVLGTRILPVWQNGAFVDQPTRSIAWAALDWWRNGDYSAGLNLADIDFATFIQLDALWRTLGHTFDYRFTEVQNLDEILETVLKAGRAYPAPVGDKLTIVRDQPRGLSRMLFTENDIVAGSLELDYTLSDEQWADGIVGEYVDERTWRIAEVNSAPDGVQLHKPARVRLEGVVNRVQATGMVRFMAAESQYRRVTAGWTARMEGKLLKKGDLVKLAADEPETWGQSREVIEVRNGGFTLRLDPAPEWEATGNHYVEIRRRDGRPWGPVKVTRGATPDLVLVDSADAASVAGAQGMSLGEAVSRKVTQEMPWVAFSPGSPRTFPVLITEGTPDQDGEHIALKGVLDAPEVYDVTETGVPLLPVVPQLYGDVLPVILGLVAQISQRQATLVLTAGWVPAKNAVSYEGQVSYDGGTTWVSAYRGGDTTFEAVVGGSATMRVRVRGITPATQPGAWYVVEVVAPEIQISGDLFENLSVEIDKLSAQTQAEIRSINEQGSGALAQGATLTADYLAAARALQAQGRDLIQEGEDATSAALRFAREVLAAASERSRGGTDLANDAIRGILKQHDESLARLGDEAATQSGDAFRERQLIKVQVGKSFAAIERETRLRVSADEVLASITTTLAVRLDTAEGGIVANATAIQGVSSRVTATEGMITAQSQQITTLSARIDAADLAISGQATAAQALTARVTLTEGNIVSLSEATTTLQSRVTGHDQQLSAQATAIDSVTTRAEQIDGRVTSEAQRTTELATTVLGHDGQINAQAVALDSLTTRTTTAEGRIESEAARTTALASTVLGHDGQINAQAVALDNLKTRTSTAEGRIESEASRTTALETTVSSQGGEISGQATALSDLTARTTTAEGRITSEASRLDSLSSTVSTQGGQLVTQADAVDKLTTRVTTAEGRIESEASRTTALASTVSDQGGQITGNADAISQLRTRTSTAEGRIESEASRTDSLATTVLGHDGKISGQARAIDDLTTRTSTNEDTISSVASRTTALESTASTQGGQISAQATALSQLTTRTDTAENNIVGLSSYANYLENTLSNAFGDIQANASATNDLTTRVSETEGQVSSQATSITSLKTTVGEHTSQITTLAASYDGVKIQYGVTGYIDGQAGGFVLTGTKSLDGSATFKLLVSADMFVDGLLTARMMSTTSLITTSAQIGNLTVDNINVKDGAISGLVSAQSNGQQASVTINVRTAGAVSIITSRVGDLSSRYQSTINTGALKIYRDGNLIGAIPAIFIMDPDFNLRASYLRLGPTTYPILDVPGIGSHTYQVVDDNNAGIGGVYISVQESK